MRNIALLGLGALCFCTSVFAQQAAPDLILYNGKIFTSDAAHLYYVQALAIRGDRIVATGDTDTVKATAGPQTKKIDLGGRTVIPGINDAHNHVEVQPTNFVDVDLKSMDPTWEQVKVAIAAIKGQARCSTRSMLPAANVVGMGAGCDLNTGMGSFLI
jgi:hypothetical protein